ncbi:RING-box protein 1a [Trifolium medium]|uniref:RING-box protein 1a n=1 Tax=Trifolium medium TaxID=97028 RepID=A0A392PTG6_9FABA|nr:RING-box protein 1a [Trifolium medium]
MATLDSDEPMVPASEPSGSAGPSSKKPKCFEIKKWNAVALWALGRAQPARSALSLGGSSYIGS